MRRTDDSTLPASARRCLSGGYRVDVLPDS
jgi:hypothetical protein